MTSASLKFCVGLAVALALGGCSTLRGALVPVPAAAPGASQVDMLVATTRSPTEPSEMFSGARGSCLSFANITVSIPPESARRVGEVQWPSRVPGSPATDFVTLKADVINQKQAMAWFNWAMAKQMRHCEVIETMPPRCFRPGHLTRRSIVNRER